MRTTTLQKLKELQRNPRNIRNICILAHVDHGKTTLADTLVASNGIISQRMAGKLRYLDSREDEQVRGITMKSSAISLHHTQDAEEYLVNLIDSPGHIDFSSEVSTAVRLCDGAIVVVDVVEGVCPQTQAVLRQAWLENIKPVLMLNKIDRLILELKLTPLEVYIHLTQLLEQVNAVTGELFTSDVLEKTSAKATSDDQDKNVDSNQVYDWSSGLEDVDDSTLYFSPDQGNVIFASAIDGWGFGLDHFAELFGKKLGINTEVLKKTLWGDFYLDSKTKRIKKGAQAKAKKPLFVQFVLENLWSVYETVCVRRDKMQIEKIISSLGLKVSTRDLRHTDSKIQLQAICSQWLPLSKAVLAMVVSQLPNPLNMAAERAEKLMCSSSRRFDSLPEQTQKLKNDFLLCSADEAAPVIVFVSKMFVIDKKSLPENRQRPLTHEEIAARREMAKQRLAEKQTNTEKLGTAEGSDTEAAKTDSVSLPPATPASDTSAGTDQVFIAFARVFSGMLKRGQQLYVLGPKHDPSHVLQQAEQDGAVSVAKSLAELSGSCHMTSFMVEQLYLFMGRELEQLDEVPAGNVLGIGKMEDHILKSATISSTVACPAFTEMYMEASPIVRVAVEPKHPGDMTTLMRGLRLLNQADPSVQIVTQETGEHVIVAAGEVHLEKCLDDLKQRYAKVDINVSKATVPFRETIIPPPKTDMVNESIQDQRQLTKVKNVTDPNKVNSYQDQDETEDNTGEDRVLETGLVEVRTANKCGCVRIRAMPLPDSVTKLLDSHASLIKTIDSFHSSYGRRNESKYKSELNSDTISAIKHFKESLSSAFTEAGEFWDDAANQIMSFGPKRTGPNLLLNRFSDTNEAHIWSCMDESLGATRSVKQWQYDSMVSGFQLATLCGPLCEEPLMGVCYLIEHCEITEESTASALVQSTSDISTDDLDRMGRLTLQGETPSPSPPLVSHKMTGTGGSRNTTYGPMSGQLMSCVKDGCRQAFQSQPQRLLVAMYSCSIQATTEVLGRMYAVLGKRNGRILEEDMKEGSNLFNIVAVLPVVESFGFAEEIRKRTSGLASPQLRFSHWEVVDIDPFWVPTTEEEYMHFGEKADSDNIARKYMNNVRRRKGLKVDEKIVEFAEKQRTLSKNK